MQITKTENQLSITPSEERLIQAMHLLGDKTRYKMFILLMTNQEMCVTDIAKQLNVTTSAVSQHFRQFELVGLVGKERTGQKICYMLDDENELVRDLVEMLKKRKYINKEG
jgi:ArsR family transcriptional regulator, lead/cadmium/zinc/bismuth-responsive transcriptional repressor